MKTILVPTDFSQQAENATAIAANLAEKTKSTIILLHVIEDNAISMVSYTGELAMPGIEDRLYIYKLIEKAKHQFQELRGKYPGVTFQEEIKIGNPYYGVQEIIKDFEIDLILMGTKGASGMQEFLIGSNAEKVVRNAKCPVLTVHDDMNELKLNTVAFATDGKIGGGEHLKVLKKLRQFFDFDIYLVRVNTPNNFLTDRDSTLELKAFADNNQLDNYKLRIYNDVTEEEGILHFANEVNADLIVMGTHGRTGLAHLIGGSIAEEVVNHTKRPVLTYTLKH
ncbi:universal stress protein [Fulvivirga lutimaris]|uniref:universal stress protein n=1 Tax=Fulvivirga lutimaris TaxID=1819566 RepID=UPI001629C6C4|nr:universal stress protein [Fulvivirga lutimaris]